MKPSNKQCDTCAIREFDTISCATWRLAFELNEVKKAFPLLGRFIKENMQCQDYQRKQMQEMCNTCLTCRHKRYGDLAEAECYNPKSSRGLIKPWDGCEFWEAEK